MKPRFLANALDEYAGAARYYRTEDPQLAVDPATEIETALNYLCCFPHAAKPLAHFYRSHKLRRFPYCLIYRVDHDELVIVALAHTARKPEYWISADTDNGS
jgi:plasmid stabilization system protein ParE